MSIYLQHFALKREPFSIVPDPGFLYPSIYHRQAVAHLKYGLDREGGFILLTGEVGTGKTTLIETIVGLQEPDTGEVHRPRDLRIGYLPQEGIHIKGISLYDEAESAFAETKAIQDEIDRLAAELEDLDPHAVGQRPEPDVLQRLDHRQLRRRGREDGLAMWQQPNQAAQLEGTVPGRSFALHDHSVYALRRASNTHPSVKQAYVTEATV